MQSSTVAKRFILPFSPLKSREPFSLEVELASVYALAELERGKGGGLIVRQPQEKLFFISQVGYPVWVYPKSEVVYMFDGLNNSNYSLLYPELPSAKAFIESLESNSKIKEDYTTFLSDHQSYFQQPKKEMQLTLKGLIVDSDFKKEFTLYRKEATELAQQASPGFLTPTLEESTVAATLTELDKLQSSFRDDAERLPECLRLMNKVTSQYVTELDFAAQAVKDEANAKIKAREEIVNPQVAKLNSEYKQKVANLTKSIDDEIENLKKQQAKAQKTIENNEEKIRQYQHEAQSQAEQNHLIYEKRWKEKSRKAKKEVDWTKERAEPFRKKNQSFE